MNIDIDAGLTDRVAALVLEIGQVEAARPPIEAEIAGEMARLDMLAIRAEAAAGWWLPTSPQVTPAGIEDSITAALLTINPAATRKVSTERIRRRCEAWRGLRLSEVEKTKRLTKLQQDLRVARARLEQRRREIEQQTNEMQPRLGDDPGIWLLTNDALNTLAAASNGRTR